MMKSMQVMLVILCGNEAVVGVCAQVKPKGECVPHDDIFVAQRHQQLKSRPKVYIERQSVSIGRAAVALEVPT